MNKRSCVLWVGVLCVALAGCSDRVKVVVTDEPVMSDRSPLLNEREMDKLSLAEFDKTVREHPEWVNKKSEQFPDSESLSVLSAYAITARTNHVRILIRNGADVMEALQWSKRNQCPECTRLILNVCNEFTVVP